VNLAVPDRERTVDLFGSPLRIKYRREFGYLKAYRLAQKSAVLRDEVPTLLTLALLIGPTDTVIDIGANVGLFSSVLSRLATVYPNMRFYAFEANADTIIRLQASLSGRPVSVVSVAVSNEDAPLEFVDGASSLVFGSRSAPAHFQIESTSTWVPGRRLDGLHVVGDSLVLKVDVEGFEREVLEGAEGLFAAGRIRMVYLDGYSDVAVLDILRSNGFDLYDGRTLRSCVPTYSLLAIKRDLPPK